MFTILFGVRTELPHTHGPAGANNSDRIPQSMAFNDFSKGSVAGTSDIDEPYHENNQLLRLLVISAN